MTVEFDWDERKNAINEIKHGVSFNEAKLVFFDPMRVDLFDNEHSETEDRWKAFGMAGWVLLMVNYTENDGLIRIISARKATQTEEEAYYYGYCTD